jgi:hypothetical protein
VADLSNLSIVFFADHLEAERSEWLDDQYTEVEMSGKLTYPPAM